PPSTSYSTGRRCGSGCCGLSRTRISGATSFKLDDGLMKRLKHVLAVAAVVGCSDAFKPTTENIVGRYEVESFTADSAGTLRDLFAAGATLELIVLPFGDVVGALNVPPIPPDTATFYASLNGTWALTGNKVRFTQ